MLVLVFSYTGQELFLDKGEEESLEQLWVLFSVLVVRPWEDLTAKILLCKIYKHSFIGISWRPALPVSVLEAETAVQQYYS